MTEEQYDMNFNGAGQWKTKEQEEHKNGLVT